MRRIIKLAVVFLLLAYYMGLFWEWNASILQVMINGEQEDQFYLVDRDQYNKKSIHDLGSTK